MTLTLVIGNKNLSSWSLRPWLLMQQAEIDFTEKKILLDLPESRAKLRAVSPSGLVPCLLEDDFEIWDSLAIMEYLADKFPEKQLWPNDIKARARARSLASEMHSGFSTLRTVWPMDFIREDKALHMGPGLARDVGRMTTLWEEARRDFGEKATNDEAGPFLFGRFSIADAMFAPVVSRLKTYGPVKMPKRAQNWFDQIWLLPAMRKWGEHARAEITAANS
jgi:glutathione S-transferase